MTRSKITEEQVKDEDFMSEYEHGIEPHSLIDLTDTPTTYSGAEGQYLRSTGSGVQWQSIAGVVIFGDGIPDSGSGGVGDVYISRTTNILYERTTESSGIAYYTDDLCTNSNSAFALSSYSGRTPDKAFDDLFYSYTTEAWNGGSEDETYIGYTFSSPKNIRKLRIASTNSYQTRIPVAFQLRASNSEPTDITEAEGGTLIYEFKHTGCQDYPNKKVSATSYWSVSEWKEWDFSNVNSYLSYWILIWDKDETSFSRASDYMLAEIEMKEFVGYAGESSAWESRIYGGKDDFIDLNDTPSSYSPSKYLKTTSTGIEFEDLSLSLMDLSDSPFDYYDGKYLKSTTSGTEWGTVADGVHTFLDLTDTPSTYSGTEGAMLVSTGSGTEFAQEGRWLDGEGSPTNNLGADGNMYLDVLNDAVHYRVPSSILDEYNTNIALTGTASADSVYNGGDIRFLAGKANDGDSSGSRWLSDTGAPHWWIVEWAEVKYVSRIGFLASTVTASEHFSEYYIEYWANGEWNESVHVTGYTDQRPTVTYHNIGKNTDKMRIRTISGNDNHGIYEFLVYGGVETVGGWEEIGSFIANSSLLGLTDTPSIFDDGKYLRSTASGTEWSTVSGVSTHTELTDTPTTYSGASGKYVTVKEDETGLEFSPLITMGSWVEVSSNYVASNGDNLMLNSTVSGIEITLPSSPEIGHGVTFVDAVGNCETYNVTITSPDSNIIGLNEDILIDFDYARFTLTYYDVANGWILGLVGYI